ncbi:MAG: outer-membrane lipoprotein carrier protein LolA, partial [Candidatus Tectomicrobia bacterium]|nr:outer-membrane lipoprotein carrier protein LolA [Candidatus Tectomicrobia bacterium]
KSKNGENYLLKLIPKEFHPALSQMILEIDPETFWIKSTKVNDVYENTIELTFTEINTNQSLPASLFQFTIPQGSELITPSKGK